LSFDSKDTPRNLPKCANRRFGGTYIKSERPDANRSFPTLTGTGAANAGIIVDATNITPKDRRTIFIALFYFMLTTAGGVHVPSRIGVRGQ
jgi:hypothetical protein